MAMMLIDGYNYGYSIYCQIIAIKSLLEAVLYRFLWHFNQL